MHRLLTIIVCCVYACTQPAFSQTIYDEIVNLNIKNERDSALSLIKKYEKNYKAHEKWDSLSKLYVIRGDMEIRAQGHKAALPHFQKADSLLSIHYSQENPFYLYYLHRYNVVLLETGKIKEALENTDYLIKTALKIKDEELYNRGITSKAILLISQNRYSQADSILKRNLSKMEREPVDTFNLMQTYSIKLWLDNYYHRKSKIVETSDKSLRLVKEKYGDSHINTAIAYNSHATAYEAVGDLPEAFRYLLKSRDILYEEFLETGNADFLASIMVSIGLKYKRIGEYNLALQYLLKGLEMKDEYIDEDNINLLWIYHAITETYIAAENLEKAREFNEKSYALIEQAHEEALDKKYQYIYVKGYEAEILFQEGHIQESLNLAREGYDYILKNEDEITTDLISILNLISLNYLETEKKEEALEWALRHYEAAKKFYFKDHSEVLLALTNVLEAQIALEDDASIYATRDSILSIRNIDNSPLHMGNCVPDKWMPTFAVQWATYLGKDIFDDEEKRIEYFEFLDDFEQYFQNHLSIIRDNVRIGQNDDNLRNIYKPALTYYYKNDPEKYLKTSEKIKAFKTRLLLQSQLHSDDDQGSPENKIRKTLMNIEEEENVETFIDMGSAYENFIKYKDSLKINDPLLYQKKYGNTDFDPETLTNLLEPDELLLEYLKIDSFLYLSTFDGSHPQTYRMSYKEIETVLITHLEQRDSESASRLYNLLLPIDISAYDKLLVFPDDKLYYLNFEELVTGENQYLIETHRLRYAYSGAVLSYQNQLAKKRTHDKNIISLTPGFSEELKNFQVDAVQTDDLWFTLLRQPFMLELSDNIGTAGNSISVTDTSATEWYLKNEAKDARVLHMGTHGIIDDASPLFSKLIFARGGGEDGILHTYEIFGQELNADLVVLSACNTGQGKLQAGEGILSLAHAFTHAGCQAVLMTLWEVDEKVTATILENFYEYLLRGETKSDALRQAKLDYLNNAPAELRAPYYWAGLVLIGSDYAVFEGAAFNQFFFLIPIVIILLIVLGFYRLRK